MASILARASAAGLAPSVRPRLDDLTRPLGLLIVDYPNMIRQTIDQLSAHILAEYLHRLAQEFSSFYNQCHILSEGDPERQAGWLRMVADTHHIMTHGLGLMGIDVPERM